MQLNIPELLPTLNTLIKDAEQEIGFVSEYIDALIKEKEALEADAAILLGHLGNTPAGDGSN